MNAPNRNLIRRPSRLPPGNLTGDPDASQVRRLRSRLGLLVVPAVLVALALPAGRLAAEEGATVVALEQAYGREMNARSHYLAYASAAEREGHCSAACLFRAVAAAESIHAAGHAAAIAQIHGRMSWRQESVVVRTTAENLRTSIDLELWERDRVYPRFAEYARQECLYDALAAINYAWGAEATHGAVFAEALERMDHDVVAPRIAMASLQPVALQSAAGCERTYYLCTGDGSMFSSPLKRACPNCGTRGARIVTLPCQNGHARALLEGGPHHLAAR